MAETQTSLLPMIALEDAVVLPHMVVTIALDSDAKRAAIAAAKQADSLLVLVPRIEGRYAGVGTIASIEESGRLSNGVEVAVVRGRHRARLSSAASEAGGALWIRSEPAPDPRPASPRAREL